MVIFRKRPLQLYFNHKLTINLAKWQPAAQSSPENAEGYDFDDFEKFMSDENLLEQLHPYSNDDLESFLL